LKKIPSVDFGLFTYKADATIMGVMPDVYSGKLTIEEALKKLKNNLKTL